ncbi:small nuclear ribonucleoprotein D3 [Strigomonas culicis]|uniref:Small nuclear ribonucleoprotein Sm D3 n=1 Tax=Strigomonas culicis TaxID=28005 RepID=S9V2S8_9TRYP|nr:small nuclear ribonucleoprotein D3 [Strigomonas culicis]EPY36968.1 small nuclear ribonucleoprotein D3 [Strigomonas culicis]|eukprot:EPY35278.1 small nuclear ribonucleoprotein D3 [Strigomonas culicis]
MSQTSVPLKVLFDAIDTTVSLEVANGEVYTGALAEVQETMNITLKKATKISLSGKESHYETVFIRGSNVVFFQLPDALQCSPALVAAGKAVAKALDSRGDGKGFGAGRKRGRE